MQKTWAHCLAVLQNINIHSAQQMDIRKLHIHNTAMYAEAPKF